ncbi:MAG: diaminopimelate epimerase [Negativicutes bacterium]|nr:diaminopimelate epimerase [Negativicutes bacterium]
MQFSKWHGIGNDFVIVNGMNERIDDYSKAAKEICHRRFGIGADGLVIVLPSDKADFTMRIFNSDGSEADMCGNATRCVARYVYESGLTAKTEITIETHAGIVKPALIFDKDEVIAVCVDMGEPRMKRGQIPMAGDPEEEAVNIPLEVAGKLFSVTGISVGNPHCVIFVDDVEEIDLAGLGPQVETHPLFPKKTNVEFVQVLSRDKLRMRVWERGAGITMACGTGASSTLVAAVLNGKTDRCATVVLDGGELIIEWREDNHVYMTGPATQVFCGEYLR